MKVLMVDLFLPDNTYAYELASQLKDYDDLTLVCKRHAAPPLEGACIRDFLYEGGKNKLQAAAIYGQSLLKLDRALKTGAWDVVHVQYFRKIEAEMPVYLRNKRHYGILCHTIHKLFPPEGSEKEKALYKAFYDECDLIMVHNQQSKKELMAGYAVPEEKIAVIPMGGYQVADVPIRPLAEDGKVHFLEFGIQRRYKAIDLLIRAVALIPEKERQRMKVSVVGPRYKKLDPTDYQAMADSMGVGDCVTVRDEFVEPKDFPALFSGVDIALVPYRELQGSGTLILAYCYLKPAIVSDLPLLMEETLDGATGLAFKNEDPADLARAMRRVLAFSEADMDERRKKIRDLVENKYNWVHSARLLHESYGLCLERKRKKGL